MKSREDMLKLKRAEMEHEHRVLLREKLALFIARTQDDISDEDKVPIPDDPSELAWQEIELN